MHFVKIQHLVYNNYTNNIYCVFGVYIQLIRRQREENTDEQKRILKCCIKRCKIPCC